MANSSTLVDITFIVLCMVFIIILCSLLIYETDITMLFLTLVSEMMSIVSLFLDKSLKILLSLLQWVVLVSASLQSTIQKEKQLGKFSIKQNPKKVLCLDC